MPAAGGGGSCQYVGRRPYKLTGKVQVFRTWTVRARDVKRGISKMALQITRKTRAFDTVPVR